MKKLENRPPSITSSVVCVCVVVPSILSAGFHLFSTFLLRCLPFFFVARRVQHSLSLVGREVEFCVPTRKSLSTVACCARKKTRLLRNLNPRPNRQKVTRLPTQPPGRPVLSAAKVIVVTILMVLVDDIFTVGEEGKCDEFGRKLNTVVPGKNLGELRWYSGLYYERDLGEGTLTVSQQTFAQDLAKKYNIYLSLIHI